MAQLELLREQHNRERLGWNEEWAREQKQIAKANASVMHRLHSFISTGEVVGLLDFLRTLNRKLQFSDVEHAHLKEVAQGVVHVAVQNLPGIIQGKELDRAAKMIAAIEELQRANFLDLDSLGLSLAKSKKQLERGNPGAFSHYLTQAEAAVRGNDFLAASRFLELASRYESLADPMGHHNQLIKQRLRLVRLAIEIEQAIKYRALLIRKIEVAEKMGQTQAVEEYQVDVVHVKGQIQTYKAEKTQIDQELDNHTRLKNASLSPPGSPL